MARRFTGFDPLVGFIVAILVALFSTLPVRADFPVEFGRRGPQLSCSVCARKRRGSRLTESCKIRKQNALAAPRSGLVISHSLAASNPAMEFVMIRLILFAWFALAAILLVATDLSEDHHLKQITSTYFAQHDNYGAEYQPRQTIRHHS